MEINVISEEEVGDIVLSMVSEEMNPDHYCEEGSVRMDIKDLQDNFNVTQKNLQHYKDECGKLLERVKVLEEKVQEKVKYRNRYFTGYEI